MKLNKRQRIGVIVSVVWILGTGGYTQHRVMDEQIKMNVQMTLSCEEAQNMKSSRNCDYWITDPVRLTKQFHESWAYAAVVAFVPVPLGWGFVYLILWLTRWVMRG